MQFVIFEYNCLHITQNRRLSPRLPCYVRLGYVRLALCRFEFEHTRPQGTRQTERRAALENGKVSTHASAGDATVVLKDVFMIALFRYFARRLRFGAFHDAQGC